MRPHGKQGIRLRSCAPRFEIAEVRLVSELRVMHAKVDELHNAVQQLRRRHDEGDIVRYSNQPALTDDILRFDEIYLWYTKLKEQAAKE